MLCILIATVLLHLPTGWGGDICPPKNALPSCTCRNVILENGVALIPSKFSDTNGTSLALPISNKTAASRINSENSRNGRALYTIVNCKTFRTLTALYETISQALHRKRIDKLIVSNVPPDVENRLARFPSRWLKHVRIKQFEVLDSPLAGNFISYDNPFQGQTNYMLSLTANRCSLKGALTYGDTGSTNTKGLEKLPKIENVDFSYNEITAIKSNAFMKPPLKLSKIVLAHNSLTMIEEGTFQNITLLNTLDLSHNLLEEVDRRIFADTVPKLENIDLSWNFLETLPVDFFNGMPALQILNLSKNFLYSLSEKPYASVWGQLKFADLTGNFIQCDCSLLWLVPLSDSNSTSPVLASSGDRIIKGKCVANKNPGYYSVLYNLDVLKRSDLMC